MKGKGDARGSITVFLALIFTALLLVCAVVTDAARIMAAQRRVQNALDSAVRSGMAGYHEGLTGEFGLYGLVLDEEEIKRYFAFNLSEQQQEIRLIEYEPVSLAIEPAYSEKSLLNDEIFRSQVLEYMEYKAPLLLGESAVEKVLEALGGGAFQQKIGFVQGAQRAISIREEMRVYLNAINGNIESAVTAQVEKTAAEIMNEMEGVRLLLQREIVPRIEAYSQALTGANSLQADEKADERTGALADQETENLLQRVNTLIKRLEESGRILSGLAPLEAELDALARNSGLSENNANKRRAAELSKMIAEGKAALPELERIDLAKPILEQLKTASTAAKEGKSICEWLKKRLPLQEIDPGILIAEDAFAIANAAPLDSNGESDYPCLREDGYYRMSEEFAARESLALAAFLADLGGAAAGMLAEGRDRLYLMEYILDKYTFLTSSTKRQHHFGKGEVEYILCGKDAELANLLDVFGHIWFFRYALNTLDVFVQSPIVHPLARMAHALAQGFFQAWRDVAELYNGRGVAVFPGAEAGVKMTYSDHLRIFLFMQNEKIQLVRMRQLIQTDLQAKGNNGAGVELGRCLTSCRASAAVDINLWFLAALHLDGLGLERFHDGKYRIIRETVRSY